MGKTIIISNRLPVRVEGNPEEGLSYIPSEGGLATGLGSVYKGGGNMWIGWPGIYMTDPDLKDETKQKLLSENMQPVFLSKKEIEDFYEGFCNSTLWPNFHYFNQYAIYKRNLWESYVAVNEKFRDAVLDIAEDGDRIWVHDYQLFLLPQLIRDKLPNASIGFFLHIPFPSHEVFRLIPWRKQLLFGVLGADLIGFHTYDDMRHFLSAVNRLVSLGNHQGQINMANRIVQVDPFPMGIDYDKYAKAAADPETISNEVEYRTSLGQQKLILSIDRLDYSKGIPQRLVIFDLFLKKYPQYQGKVSLILLVVPSRDKVAQYMALKEEVDLLVGRINGTYGSMNWTPIHYFYRSLDLPKLSALYRMADVAMVTPMRDGMNLVCKEFVASKLDKKGVLILSEMAGASKELSDAILINPNDKHQVADAIKTALEMSLKDQRRALESMQKTIKRYNVHHWVDLFLTRLDQVTHQQDEFRTKLIDESTRQKLFKDFQSSKSQIIFLDYDGTLVEFQNSPEKAKPDKELIDLLKSLSEKKGTKVVIISGRERHSLENWLGSLNVDIIAEHGIWLRQKGSKWETIDDLNSDWKEEIKPILEMYVSKTPGSLIEEKDFSLVWHFRKVETGLGELRSREIFSHLRFLSEDMNLHVLEGDKVVEIKNAQVDKGRAAAKWLKDQKYDYILAVGDDRTDEDTFEAMPKGAYTVKVGGNRSSASYSIKDPASVRELLKGLL